jgi:hypothetical protein
VALKAAAKGSGRSLNSEVIHRLERSFENQTTADVIREEFEKQSMRNQWPAQAANE